MPSSISVLTRPSKEEIRAAAGQIIPDVIAPELKVLFCGINPGLYSGATGYHFARPGNRFWPTLYRAGFMDRLLSPFEEARWFNLAMGSPTWSSAPLPARMNSPSMSSKRARGGWKKRCAVTGRGTWPCWASAPIAWRSQHQRQRWAGGRKHCVQPCSGCCLALAA